MTKELWQRYWRIWQLDAVLAATELVTCLEPTIRYSDPTAALIGYKDLADYMASFRKGYPGHGFVVKAVKDHHGMSLARWDIVDPKGRPLIPGLSFGILSTNAKFMAIAAFYGDIADIFK